MQIKEERRIEYIPQLVIKLSVTDAECLGSAILAIDPEGYDDQPIAADFANKLLEFSKDK